MDVVHIFLLTAVLGFPALCSQTSPRLVESSAFEDIKNGRRLDGNVLQTDLDVISASKCGLSCNRKRGCRAFSFCDGTTCYMHSEDIFSTEAGENILIEDSSCTYYGMNRESEPTCEKNGKIEDIQTDEEPDGCSIVSKRIDRVWGSWNGVVDIDSGTEWKEVMRRDVLVDAAHGGLTGEDESEKVFSWLKFVKEGLTWHEAKDNCVTLGGRLFSDLDGTMAQINFLVKRMEQNLFWLGIYTEDHNVWKSVTEEVIDTNLMRWKSNEPNDFNGNEDYLGVYVEGSNILGVNDFPDDWELWSVCDMEPLS